MSVTSLDHFRTIMAQLGLPDSHQGAVVPEKNRRVEANSSKLRVFGIKDKTISAGYDDTGNNQNRSITFSHDRGCVFLDCTSTGIITASRISTRRAMNCSSTAW